MQRSGFTLIELLVTIALMAFLAAFAVPSYQIIISQYELSTAASRIADTLRVQEQQTVTQQLTYGITLTVGATSIPQFLYTPSTDTETVQSTYYLPYNVQISQVNLTSGDIRFSTSGAPNYSGNVVIRDLARNRYRRITLGPSGVIELTGGEF